MLPGVRVLHLVGSLYSFTSFVYIGPIEVVFGDEAIGVWSSSPPETNAVVRYVAQSRR